MVRHCMYWRGRCHILITLKSRQRKQITDHACMRARIFALARNLQICIGNRCHIYMRGKRVLLISALNCPGHKTSQVQTFYPLVKTLSVKFGLIKGEKRITALPHLCDTTQNHNGAYFAFEIVLIKRWVGGVPSVGKKKMNY